MVVSFVFPNVRTWQQRLEALKTAGGISTSGHSLNSSSYSLCLRHKYKEKYKCNHKDKYKCNRQDYYRVKAQIQKQNNDTHHQQHKHSLLLFLELCFLSSIGFQVQLLQKKYYLVFQSNLCQGIHCQNMLVSGKNEIVTFNWTENSISMKQKKLHYEKA